MSREAFDPTRAAGAGASPGRPSVSNKNAPNDKSIFSPSSLSWAIEEALAQQFPGTIKLRGEVSNFRERNHWYFALKDVEASIACTCWASTARKQLVAMEDGLEVLVTGRMAFYGPQGKLQLIVSKVEQVGRGALEAELRQRSEELRRLGYFDDDRKKPLPLMPEAVAIVTSRSAAALQDVIDTARRRWPGVKLFLYDVRVQGEKAAGEIAAAIEAIGQGRAVDEQSQGVLGASSAGLPGAFRGPVIVTRGGGSMEDLWAFNERAVCDAIFRCPVPVVAAIGHETDTTLAELCADRRAATPTQAATLLVPERDRLVEQLRQTQDRLRLVIGRRVAAQRQTLEAYARHPVFRRPDEQLLLQRRQLDALQTRLNRVLPARLQAQTQRLDELSGRLQRGVRATVPDPASLDALALRLQRAITTRVQQSRQAVDGAEKRLTAVSPDRVLQRGFSYTVGPDGRVLKRADQARSGQVLTTVLAEGKLQSRVLGDGSEAPPPARKKRPTRKPPRGQDDQQGALF